MKFDNSYSQLPENFYERVNPQPRKSPYLIGFNSELAKELDLEIVELSDKELAEHFSGSKLFKGSDPIAQAYAGHQFAHFVPQLGDGRAVLLGEVIDPNGDRFDIQLKGSGRTRFSRQGDGNSALGPVIREYIVSEAMHALKIPTTRALAAVGSGESVERETMKPGGIFTRIASSHIRIGTFQYFASQGDHKSVRTLLNYSIQRHYPELISLSEESKPIEFFKAVIRRQASLVAKWMSVGFIHGVMNTDNTSVSGETIDYGPCAFMDSFSFSKVFSSIDRNGRYAYGNQPQIIQWNLLRLAECLVPLVHSDEKKAIETIESVIPFMHEEVGEALAKEITKKFNWDSEKFEEANEFLKDMEREERDFTNTFRAIEGTEEVNPAYIPRNHLVERAISDANNGNFDFFHEMNTVLKNPFTEHPDKEIFARPPKPDEEVHQTFCGT